MKSIYAIQSTFVCVCRRDCASLRVELSQHHNEDTQSALAELASLKDGLLRQAQEEWENDKRELIGKVCHIGLIQS